MTRIHRTGRLVTAPVVLAMVIAGLFVAPARAATYPASAPTGMHGDPVANTYAVMYWNAVSGADSYSFRYAKSSSSPAWSYRVPSDTHVQINNLTPSTTYRMQVRARDNGKDISDWSSTYTVKTTNDAFPPPSAPKFDSNRIREDSFKVTWGEVPNASRYQIELQVPSGQNYFYYTPASDNAVYLGRGGDAQNAQGATIYDDDGNVQVSGYPKLQPNSTYWVRVRALEAKSPDGDPDDVYALTGFSYWKSMSTNSWSVYPPYELKVESTTSAGITLSWQDVGQQEQGVDGASYRIQYWLNGSSTKHYVNTDRLASHSACGALGSGAGAATVVVTLKRFCDLDPTDNSEGDAFTAGKGYRFRVSAIKSGDSISDYTASAGIYAVASAEPLATPDDLRVDKVDDRSMTLSWQTVPGATSYRLQQKLSSTSGSTRYLYDVCRSSGSPVTCTVSGGRTSVTLTRWQDNDRGTSSALSSNQTYYIRIAAQKGVNEGDPSLQARASDYSTSYLKVKLTGWPYEPPSGMNMTTHDSTSITWNWDPINMVGSQIDPAHPKVRYRIQYSTEETMANARYATTSTVNATSLRIGGLRPSTSYLFRIRAVDENDSGTFSDYTEIGKPWSARTLGHVGKARGTLTTQGNCSPDDYELVAYWGDEVEESREPSSSTSTTGSFSLDNLLVGADYNFRYEYLGSGNCVSVWVSNNTDAHDESHMLKDLAGGYPVSEGQTLQIRGATSFPGVSVSGKVTYGSTGGGNSGTANPNVQVSAIAGPKAGGPYRELHDMIFTAGDGTYQLRGLWPGYKYKFSFRGTGAGMTGAESTYTVWEDTVDATHPGANFNVWLCNGIGGSCAPNSNYTQGDGESSGGTNAGGYPNPVPHNLHVTSTTPMTMDIQWDNVAGAQFYRVQYSTHSDMSGASYAGFENQSGATTGGTLTGLTTNKVYYLRVAMVADDGSADGGAKLSDYTQPTYPTGTPTWAYGIPGDLSCTAGGVSATSMPITWDAVPGAPKYRVQYSKNATMSQASYAGFSTNGGNLTGLSRGTVYYLRVAVVEDDGSVDGGSKLGDYTQKPYATCTTSN